MTIRCGTKWSFFETIAELVARGLGFEADADTLDIKLTGSH